ncbi:acidic mammalian chitinase-like [Tachypleus tridentatus]|uniref:acidic mammalian chitinase-like n=1 Tax=Tachypleus tridentatus TaxID=6853 RepID=UPI003FD12B4B
MVAAEYALATMALLLTTGVYYAYQDRYLYYKGTLKEFEEKAKEKKAEVKPPLKRVCYYTIRHGYKDTPLKPDLLDPSVCTHIIVGFASIAYDYLAPKHPKDLYVYGNVTALKVNQPELKVLLSVGAGSGGKFSAMVNSPPGRKKFVTSAVALLEKFNFDGIDFDWEFPAWKGSPPLDRVSFIYLLRDFRNFFKAEEKEFLLTAAVAAPRSIVITAYDIPALAHYLDFVNLMCYDFHYWRPSTPYTSHHSPLYQRPDSQEIMDNVAWTSLYWVGSGMPKEKIMIGIPMYARTYILADPHTHDIDSFAKGPGRGQGKINYNEVCRFLKEGAQTVFDEFSFVPYAFKGYEWIAYESEKSVTLKAKWAKKQGFGGVMTYNLNRDDWNATCDGQTRFPLHNAIRDALSD